MSRLLGPLQLECDPFFGPRVVCKVSTKMGNSSAGSGSILTKNMEQEAKKKSWLSYHYSLYFLNILTRLTQNICVVLSG